MRLLSRVLAAVLLLAVLFPADAAEAATKPSAPRSVKAAPLDKAVRVTWTAPASAGGSRVNAYAVQRRNTTTSPWVTVKYTGAAARAWTERGLVNGQRFHYRVMARNGVGWGKASPQVSAVPRTVPGAPRYVEADVHAGALGVYWKAPASNGGAAITSYRVEWSVDGATWAGSATSTTARTSATPLLVPLTVGTRYWLRVRARNAAGWGTASGAGPYRVYTTPGAVTDLAADVGTGQVQLSWTPPAPVTNAPAVVAYLVEVRTVGGTTWTTDSTPAQSPWVVDGLINGVEHEFRVSALTGFGKLGPGPGTVIGPVPLQGLSISPSTVEVTEGDTASAHVVLAFPASEPTEVAVSTTDTATAQTTTTTVLVPAGETTADVTVEGVQDDDLVDGTTTLTAVLGDLQATATVDVTDDDTQAVVVAPAETAVVEGGSTSVDVSLAYRPSAPVTVTVDLAQEGEHVEVEQAELVFGPDDWDVARQLTVHGLGAGPAVVHLTAPGATPAAVLVTVQPVPVP